MPTTLEVYAKGKLAPWQEETLKRVKMYHKGTFEEMVDLWYKNHEELIEGFGGECSHTLDVIVKGTGELKGTKVPRNLQCLRDTLVYCMRIPELCNHTFIKEYKGKVRTSQAVMLQRLYDDESLDGRLKFGRQLQRLLKKYKSKLLELQDEGSNIYARVHYPADHVLRDRWCVPDIIEFLVVAVGHWNDVLMPCKRREEQLEESGGLPYKIRINVNPTSFATCGFLKADSGSCYNTLKEYGWVPSAITVAEKSVFYEIFTDAYENGKIPCARAWGFAKHGEGFSWCNLYTNDNIVKNNQGFFHEALRDYFTGGTDAKIKFHLEGVGNVDASGISPYINSDTAGARLVNGRNLDPSKIGKWPTDRNVVPRRWRGVCAVSERQMYEGDNMNNIAEGGLALASELEASDNWLPDSLDGSWIEKANAIQLTGNGRWCGKRHQNRLVKTFDGAFEHRDYIIRCPRQGICGSTAVHMNRRVLLWDNTHGITGIENTPDNQNLKIIQANDGNWILARSKDTYESFVETTTIKVTI